jgi:hypothetical protein
MRTFTWLAALLALCSWSFAATGTALAHGGTDLHVIDCEDEDGDESAAVLDCEDEDGDESRAVLECEEDGDDAERAVLECHDDDEEE